MKVYNVTFTISTFTRDGREHLGHLQYREIFGADTLPVVMREHSNDSEWIRKIFNLPRSSERIRLNVLSVGCKDYTKNEHDRRIAKLVDENHKAFSRGWIDRAAFENRAAEIESVADYEAIKST